MSFKYRSDLVQADAAFEAEAPDQETRFSECARAMFGLMADEDSVSCVLTRVLNLEDRSGDMLLHRWLSDLIYLKDKESVLFREFSVHIENKDGLFSLKSVLKGEKIDPARHRLGTDVKGISFYKFSLESTGGLWKAFVVCDL